jgi:hypothetical protein
LNRYLCIACEVLARPLYLAAAISRNVVDIQMLRRGLHNTPKDLQSNLQAQIDAADGKGYQAVLLGYGLCGNGAAGLRARSIPLVIPRVHDCIGLLLGDPARYRQQYDQTPGTYWYTQDFMERTDGDSKFTAMGATSDDEMQNQYDFYVAKYGKEKADYLVEVMGSWQSRYERAAFIDLGLADASQYELQTQSTAAQRGWRFEKLAGDLGMFHDLLNGDWGEHFIVLSPGQQVDLSYNDCIFSVAPDDPEPG